MQRVIVYFQAIFLVAGLLVQISTAFASSATPLGQVVYIQGQVEIQPSEDVPWTNAQNEQIIFPGTILRTGAGASAAVLCADESQIRLGENTVILFRESAASPGMVRAGFVPASRPGRTSIYRVRQGRIWLRNANEKSRLEIITPAVTAAVRGTEFTLRVEPDGFSSLALLYGSIFLSNPYGEIQLFTGEMGTARPGQAPVRQVLVSPRDAVQWTLYYPGIISYKDLPLSLLPGPPPSAAETAFDTGETERAEKAAAAYLASVPGDYRALTLLGWIALRDNNPEQALEYFERAFTDNIQGDARLVTGLALTYFRLGNAARALDLFQNSLPDFPMTPEISAMAGFFFLMTGQPEQALEMLNSGLDMDPNNVLCLGFLAQILIVQDRKDEARKAAFAGLEASPHSPMANMTAALVHIAFFELDKALERLQAALDADSKFITALVYLARLHLGNDRLDQAWKTIRPALEKAPAEARVLSTAGFIRLGFRDYDQARKYFEKATGLDPGHADSRMGLSQYYFARGHDFQGLMHALAATLLDPRVSLYQSFLGKALYQTRSHDKALEMYDYAKTLDPSDPTPYLYKGIALTDLNRPGEAVQEFNSSIALNDNRAIFRTRLMLDRDLAVRNYDLARAYSQLGLEEWAVSKALTAVSYDQSNPSAHHFLYLAESSKPVRERHGVLASDYLLFKLLSPANQNTFTFTNDYTPMFEAPYTRMQVRGDMGMWSNTNTIYNYSLGGSGGRPGIAGWTSVSRERDSGFRQPDSTSRDVMAQAMVKWEPAVDHSLLFQGSCYDNKSGDTFYQRDRSYSASPNMNHTIENHNMELGYTHRFSPTSIFLGHAGYNSFSDDLDDHIRYNLSDPGWRETLDVRRKTKQDNFSFQSQQRVETDNHTFMAGMSFMTGTERFYWENHFKLWYYNELLHEELYPGRFSGRTRCLNAYLADFWTLHPDLIMEISMSYDWIKSDIIDGHRDMISPRLGLNWRINRDNTMRLALQHYMVARGLEPQLQPARTAGFPGQRNAADSSEITEAGISMERQWDNRTFSAARVSYLRSKEPIFRRNTIDRYQGEVVVNRILTPSLGISLSGLVKSVKPDKQILETNPEMDYLETRGTAAMSLRRPSGLGVQLSAITVYQDFQSEYALDLQGQKRKSSAFALLNSRIFREFPEKRGFIALSVNNILGSSFTYLPDSISLDSFYPDRQILFSAGVNF